MIGTRADGAIGPNTLRVLETYVKQEGLKGTIEQYQKDRLAYYKKLKHFKTFGKGWTRRNKETTASAKKMI